MKIIDRAQRVSIPAGGFYLRGVIDGRFSETAPITEEIEPDLFISESHQAFRVLTWFPPSKSTSEYETIPADWPALKNAQESIF